jgi:hypothetical protein
MIKEARSSSIGTVSGIERLLLVVEAYLDEAESPGILTPGVFTVSLYSFLNILPNGFRYAATCRDGNSKLFAI